MNNRIKVSLFICFVLPSLLSAQEKFKLDAPQDTIAVQEDTTAVEAPQQPEEPAKMAIALLDLDANNVEESEARTLTDRLRIEIFNAGIFDVMERDKMNNILTEMQFQLSGCTSDECAVEIGRMIGVSKMIAGSVGKVGEYYTVTARIIDVETGKIEKTATEDIQGAIGMVLTRAVPSLALKISGLKKQTKTSFLNIRTEPDGAVIYINEIYRGFAPLELNVEPNNAYKIRAEKSEYEPWEKIYEPNSDQTLDIAIVLSKIPEEKIVYQEVPVEPKKRRKFNQGFKVRYVQTHPRMYESINNHINVVNRQINVKKAQLFKEDIDGVFFPYITSFNGIEIFNLRQIANVLSFDFGLGFYRADIGQWISNLGDEAANESVELNGSTYHLVTWSPQLTLNLRVAPIRYILFYPYFNIGGGYDVLLMTAYKNDESMGGPVYHSFGVIYGVGFELKPFKFIGVAVELNRRMMKMQIMDLDKVTDRFKRRGLKDLDLSGNNLGFSLYLYY